MSSLPPLVAQVSKKQRGKAKKYVVDQDSDTSSPYASLGAANARRYKRGVDASSDEISAEDPKKCLEYEEALRRRDFRQVLWMITNGDIPANYESKNGETALLAAVSAKNVDALAMLMKSGVSIDTPSKKGYMALMKAVAMAVPEPKSLLKRKLFPHISATPNNNIEELANSNPPSDRAFDNGIVETVLAYEPNLLQIDRSGRSALDWAKLTGNTQALQWLQKRQQDKSIQHQSLANRQERVAQCTELLQRHERYVQHIKRLIAPQFFDEEELVKFLRATTIKSADFTKAYNDLQAMEDSSKSLPSQSKYFVNIETREGWSPLAKCAAFGYVAGVQELLAMGADLHYETRL